MVFLSLSDKMSMNTSSLGDWYLIRIYMMQNIRRVDKYRFTSQHMVFDCKSDLLPSTNGVKELLIAKPSRRMKCRNIHF